MKNDLSSICMLLAIASLNTSKPKYQAPRLKKGASYEWKIRNKKYKNFTDLGEYVIDCDRHTDFDLNKALEYANKRCYDVKKNIGCSALGTKTKKGEVIIGRNLDLTVSQLPCYITHVKSGKYDTINFTYDELFEYGLKYDELLEVGEIDEDYYNALPLMASDSMNSQGLYLEYNMRGYEKQFICFGTNPKAKTRICTACLPYMITSNCATVDEALKYMKECLDIYTLIDETVASGWNLCLMIGDATGNYGLIEIANDEIKYLPQQHGQGNYYIYPEYNSTSREQSGYGRLQYGLERIDKVQNDAQMSALMEKIMWRNEILNIPHAYRDENGHIHFCEDAEHTTSSLDWRSDNVKLIPVNKNGKYVDIDDNTEEARCVRKYKKCYDEYKSGNHDENYLEGYDKYLEYLNRCNLVWVHTNDNFEDLQRGLIKHYTENGTFEKLVKYYSGDEKPLRDDSNVWTTSLSICVNCTQKRMTIKFWENENVIFHYQW